MELMTTAQLDARMEYLRQSPLHAGELKLIVSRPKVGTRQVQQSGELSLSDGLVGDSWKARESRNSSDGTIDSECQLNIMNSRAAELVAQTAERWPLAGDQLYVDLNLGAANLPVGTKLKIGTAVIEVTSPPHTGCSKFMARFGRDATKFVNSPAGRALNLRGINARVVEAGAIRIGDMVEKLDVVSLPLQP